MQEYKVLIEGFAREGSNDNFYATCSTTLIWSNDKTILVDPGAHSELLLESMRANNIEIDDIDIIYLSHYHPDHFLNIRLFPNAQILDGEVQWFTDSEERFHEEFIPETEVKILQTPGHSAEHTSLLIETESKGTVCIAQDVFWWKDGLQKTDDYDELINLEDEFASDMKSLRDSRKKVLEIADWIIPGHGKPFQNIFKSK